MPFIGRGGIFTFLPVAVRTPGKNPSEFQTEWFTRHDAIIRIAADLHRCFLRAVLKNVFFKPIFRVFYRDALKKGGFSPRLNEKGA